MHPYEKKTMNGLFLIIAGVFLPWYSLNQYERIGNQVSLTRLELVAGYNLTLGWVMLAAALGAAVLTFLPKGEKHGDRRRALLLYLLALIAVLLAAGGFAPLFTLGLARPHLGLFITAIGLVAALLGANKAPRGES